MTNIRIGGVPEHFNYPWYLTIKNGEYKAEGINLLWKDYPGGTGEMAKALKNNELDLAVVLTEGIVKAINDGNPSKIVQTYVSSPLIWGIHTAYKAKYKNVADLVGTKAAISRFGSGSHLMAFIQAQQQGWNTEIDLNFELIKNLDGAVESLVAGTSDYFMWEKYTTKPLVDNKTFKRIGELPTPWPCFVIAASDSFLNTNPNALKAVLKIINNTTEEFKDIPSIDRSISNHYEQQLADVQNWLSITEWSQKQLDTSVLDTVQKKLQELKILATALPYNQLLADF